LIVNYLTLFIRQSILFLDCPINLKYRLFLNFSPTLKTSLLLINSYFLALGAIAPYLTLR